MPKILTDPRQSILKEVQRLLSREGYGAVTIRSVAAGCGLAVGTVYNYFPSKEALLAEYLLTDWRQCIAAIDAAGAGAEGPEPVARCICDELLYFARKHRAIFQDTAAKGVFAGSFSQYHALLRSQLAAPLRRFCQVDFTAEFAAEALITWTLAGKDFHEIWGLLSPVINTQ